MTESLVDLLLNGEFRGLLQMQVDSSRSKNCDPRVKNTYQRLNNRAVTYIDSDWNIFHYTYDDLIKYCHSVSGHLSTLTATASFIGNVSTDDNDSEAFEVSPVLVIYGDCAHLTPVFMISANLVGFAFYSVDKPEQLKEARRKLPLSTLNVFICHKYRLNELKHLLGGDYQSLIILEDYYLIYFPNESQGSLSKHRLDIAYLINTSGTSSSLSESIPASKHIFVPQSAIVRNIIDFKSEYSLTSTDVVFLCSPFSFDPSLCDTFLALSSFAHLVIASSTARNSSANVRRIITSFGITYTTCTPSLWHKLFFEVNTQLLKSLRYINFGGELSLPVKEIKSSILSYNSNIRVCNLYGLTEVSVWASMFSFNLDHLNVITSKYFSDQDYYLEFLPILGRPLLDTEVYLEDGQLIIESTARRCLILTTDNRWIYKSKYYTGDCGHELKENDLNLTYYLRRNCQTDFVKINGVKCYLPSIELSICDEFRYCKDFQVIQCTALSGDWHEIKVVDLIIQLGQQTVSSAQVKRTILSHLAHQSFAFRCHLYDHSTVASILGSNGKLDHGKLRRQLMTTRQFPQIEDSNEIESTVHSIIASTLGVELKVIEANKDKALHHIGAASMTALQISIQIDQTFASRLAKNESHNLFETVMTKNVDAIIDYVRRLISGQSDSNPTVQEKHPSVENTIKCVVIEEIPQTFTISHHCQLRKVIQLDETKRKPTEPVSISHQWSLFMEECVDATPLIVQYGQMMYLVAASHSGIVFALDPFTTFESYRQLWSTQLSNRIESSLIASTDGSLVFIGDYSGHLTALQTESGNIIWSFKTGDLIKCTPTVYGHLVICGSHDRHLYCWQDSGQLQWKVNLANLAIFSSPVVHDGTQLLCCTFSGTIASVALYNGIIQWQQSVSKNPIFSTPLLVEKTAVIGLTDNAIVSISLVNGYVRWKVPTDGPIVSSPVAFQAPGESATSAIIGTQGKSVICFNALTGDQLWRHQTSSVLYSSPFLVSQTAILVETDAILHLLDCQTGKPISVKTEGSKVSRSEQYQMATKGQVFSSPIWHNGKLFIGARDSCLHCFAVDL